VADFLRQGLGMAPSAPAATLTADSMIQIGPHGLPVLRCQPGAPAARMSAQELTQIEQPPWPAKI